MKVTVTKNNDGSDYELSVETINFGDAFSPNSDTYHDLVEMLEAAYKAGKGGERLQVVYMEWR